MLRPSRGGRRRQEGASMFEWVAIGDALPDCDETVLLGADAWALPVYGVTHWAHMPPHPADVHAARHT